MMSKRNFSARAFTLIELLVVVAIIAVLAGLILGAVSAVKKKSGQTVAISNMRQAGVAFNLYAAEHDYQLPGRLADAPGAMPKWPALLAGTDGTGTPNVSTNYIGDVRVYAAPGDTTIDLKRNDLFNYLTVNSANHTSWIMNGYNDLGTKDNPGVQIRTVAFTSASNTIILGIQNSGAGNFYMDFADGDNKTVLNLSAYNGGSTYLFADGSARFITQKEYSQPAPSGSGAYGDWLWLADKSSNASQ